MKRSCYEIWQECELGVLLAKISTKPKVKGMNIKRDNFNIATRAFV